MKFKELIILLPCHSLEDFPLYHDGEEAQGLLAAWTAMWHPAFLAAAGNMPSWDRADSPRDDLGGCLLIIPEVSESLLLAGWPARAKNEGACVVRKVIARDEIIAAGLAELDGGDGGVASELVRDFLALGFAYLQEELLTRQMRYMSNLDEPHFNAELLSAVTGAMEKDEARCKQHLQNCFDVLTEARERFYPAEAYLLDLTLVAPTTLGAALKNELSAGFPVNVLASGECIQQMSAEHSETLQALREAIEAGTATLVGGEYDEADLPLLPIESVLSNFRRGAHTYREQLGAVPEIFGRRCFGLSPALPQILSRSGFIGALHFTLDEGRFPSDEQAKARWEGLDSSGIDMLSRLPLDVAQPDNFLRLCEKISETMDLHHVATASFAHWPGQSSNGYDDLRRIARYAPVLGRFVTLRDYFTQTDSPGHITQFHASQYRSPYLKQAIIRQQPDPLSRIIGLHRRRQAAEHEQTLAALVSLLTGEPPRTDPGLLRTIDEGITATYDKSAAEAQPLDAQIAARLEKSAHHFADILPREGAAQPGYLVLNPAAGVRRMLVDVSKLEQLPDAAEHVIAAQADGDTKRAVVEVPPMGYAWVTAGSGKPQTRGKKEPPLGDKDECVIRNDFIEVKIDETTGGIRAIRDYGQRGNRLSQQIALRLPGPRPRPGDVWRDPDETAIYSVMAADSVEITSTGPAIAEAVSRGRVMDKEGQVLARYRQTLQTCRGSRIVLMDVELDIEEPPRADPWNSYYAIRFAWADAAADLFTGAGTTCQPCEGKRIETPQVVEIRTPKNRTAILTGGLPFHRRVGMRMLDTMINVRPETVTRFQLGIGVDLPAVMPAALQQLSPAVAVYQEKGTPQGAAASWLFHLDARNVAATHWEPLVSESGTVEGFRARLLETGGRPIRAHLQSFRPIATATQVDFQGQTLAQLPVEDERVVIDFAACEWVELEARWKD